MSGPSPDASRSGVDESSSPLTRELCREHLLQRTFRFQAPEYGKKYPKWPGMVGLEIEMQPFIPKGSAVPQRVPLFGSDGSIAELLSELARQQNWTLNYTEDDHGQKLLLTVGMNNDDNISFEPGGQIEFSSKPYPCLSDATRRMREVQKLIEGALAPGNIELVQIGINPWHAVPEVGLQMQKGRYRAMDRYFAAIGEYGQRMMRQTCTFQVNLDFGPDEETLASRYLASMLLAPLAAATFSYSGFVDGRASGVPGFRTRVWRGVDPLRTGVPGLAQVAAERTLAACVDTYLDFALAAPVVFIAARDYVVPEPRLSFGEWLTRDYLGARPTLDDFVTHLTLLFPEVRPRGFLEMRSIDCQPRALQSAPAAYMAGLLYDPQSMQGLLDVMVPYASRIPEFLAEAEKGPNIGTELGDLCLLIMQMAREGYARLPSCFKDDRTTRELALYDEHFTMRGRTPAHDVVEACAKQGVATPSPAILMRLEEHWQKLVEVQSA